MVSNANAQLYRNSVVSLLSVTLCLRGELLFIDY